VLILETILFVPLSKYEEVFEFSEIFCSCGCGMTLGHPMEFVNGHWVAYLLDEEYLSQLALNPHPKIHSQFRSSDTLPTTSG
jgi:hypothetical protein